MEFLENESEDGWREGVAHDAENFLSFAESAPALTAAYGAGSCLFLAGFAPSDWVDGTALTWVVLNVRRAELEAVIRLSPTELVLEGSHVEVRRGGAAVRAFDGRFAFTISRNEDGVFIVERYRLPRLDCAAWSREET